MYLDQLTPAAQDYIKLIYELTEGEGRTTTNELAAEMGVRPASVTGMLQKLAQAEPAVIDYEKWRGVGLTATGRLLALELIRHHRLLETFLHDHLGYEWDEVHEEAHRLEHVISEALEDRMAEMMGHPERDPHGALIPDANLEWPTEAARTPLSACAAGTAATIAEVADEDAGRLQALAAIGLLPHTPITVVSTGDSGWQLQIGADTAAQAVPATLIQHIIVYTDTPGDRS
ncbi:MAG: metal-dependent transcriptional regulator [Anaerolineales bacterium]|nr:metal-dependent transcriptional regulator [Anaerolineales bacterium]MCB0012534.1 metal-dependent transcriptional regulator [Anaerolineales bacterium]MCB8961196.1 metal-dependent transcriptional regulator [Ardenticatenales bacterium]